MTDNPDTLRVAIATEDGATISAHFGRAPFFEVVTIQDGVVRHRERRSKAFHSGAHHAHSEPHDASGLHATMIDQIRDCRLVVARGMGAGMYQHLRDERLTPILTAHKTIDEAIRDIIAGTIADHPERVHRH